MKNILKFLFVLLALPMLFTSCNNDADRDWTTPEASFKLHQTTLGSPVLYETMKDNPFTLSWDNTLGSSAEYTILVSATEDFAAPVTLGKTTGNYYTGTIAELNAALLQAGFSPYSSSPVYIKVVSGTNNSNVITFNVTPYPSAAPVITAPTAGSSIVLEAAKADEVATTFTWNDYTYGTDVVYLVELAKKGSTEFIPLGTVNNIRVLEISHIDLNKAVLRLGGTADDEAEYDVKVTATTTSTGGTINAASQVVTFKVTPYQLESYIYALGGFNGWSHDAAVILTSATSDGIYVGYINFPAAGTEFKITEGLNWDVNYGDNGADGILDQGGDNIKSPDAGYHRVTVDLNTNTITVTPEVWGVIGSATPTGWDSDTKMTWNDQAKVWELTLDLTVGEIKFRQNGGWDVNYGDNGGDGSLEPGADNIKVSAAGTYKIVFDIFNLNYRLIKQ